MPYGWIDIDTVTVVAHGVYYMPQTCLKMPMPLINCTVNNALVSATVPRIYALQFIDVIQLWLINSLLRDTPYIAVYQWFPKS